jgi:hypothetical protein
MHDVLVVEVKEEQREMRAALREINNTLTDIKVELSSMKARMTILSAGGAALFAAMVWALQYLLTH